MHIDSKLAIWVLCNIHVMIFFLRIKVLEKKSELIIDEVSQLKAQKNFFYIYFWLM